jgi:hypothetical protein
MVVPDADDVMLIGRSWPTAIGGKRVRALPGAVLACCASLALALCAAHAQARDTLPEIRTHAANRVPACATPARLMRFTLQRNPGLEQRFRDIAQHYRQHGEALHVRWDYAFFQMLLETNFLSFRTGSGAPSDVSPKQNNFAGLGTTGGGVPGDSFPDVSTGVLAQMQHLIAYSGERVEAPAARRTREKQDDIIVLSKALKRPVTFADLTRRWATDRHYGTSIEAIAERFRGAHCNVPALARAGDEDTTPPAPRKAAGPAAKTAAPEAASRPPTQAAPQEAEAGEEKAGEKAGSPGATLLAGAGPGLLRGMQPALQPTSCRIWTASYGGAKSILIRAMVGAEVHLTALQVLEGFEKSLADSYIRAHAQGGEAIGEFDSREAALAHAFDLCSGMQQRAPPQ